MAEAKASKGGNGCVHVVAASKSNQTKEPDIRKLPELVAFGFWIGSSVISDEVPHEVGLAQ